MRWTQARIEIGRSLFGALWNPESAAPDEIEDIKLAEQEEMDEENDDTTDGIECSSCFRVHGGNHCEGKST